MFIIYEATNLRMYWWGNFSCLKCKDTGFGLRNDNKNCPKLQAYSGKNPSLNIYK